METFDLISRWRIWANHENKCKVRIDGSPTQAKITLAIFEDRPLRERNFEMSVTDEEIFEIHSLTARWLYAHYGQDMDDLHKRHKERFGEHWHEEEERIIKEKYMKCKRRYQSLLTPRRRCEDDWCQACEDGTCPELAEEAA